MGEIPREASQPSEEPEKEIEIEPLLEARPPIEMPEDFIKPKGVSSKWNTVENNSKRANEITSIMLKIYKGKEELLIPIYDFRGNLWWPKRMSYEEVKKFIEERNKNKKEN